MTRTVQSFTVDAPGASIGYDIHGSLDDGGTPLFMFGSPMDASGFTALASRFTDRPVVTYDPRGAGRSVRTDDADVTTVDEQADDLRRVIEAVGAPRVDVFASSGGAVNVLALVCAGTSSRLGTVVAHEPPMAAFLPDRDAIVRAAHGLKTVLETKGYPAAMARFIQFVMHAGPYPDDFDTVPAPDPAMFGIGPDAQPGSNDRALLVLNRDTTSYRPDLDALRATPTRVVLGYGAESSEQMPARGTKALAEQLGVEPVVFPSHHGGFTEGPHGMGGDPDAFAVTLREVLDAGSGQS